MILDVKDFDLKTRFLIRCIKVVNVYDQIINRGYIYLETYARKRRIIKNINWNKIITKRTIFIDDFNAYNSK